MTLNAAGMLNQKHFNLMKRHLLLLFWTLGVSGVKVQAESPSLNHTLLWGTKCFIAMFSLLTGRCWMCYSSIETHLAISSEFRLFLFDGLSFVIPARLRKVMLFIWLYDSRFWNRDPTNGRKVHFKNLFSRLLRCMVLHGGHMWPEIRRKKQALLFIGWEPL